MMTQRRTGKEGSERREKRERAGVEEGGLWRHSSVESGEREMMSM
jgi:hypothetical protein